MNLQTFHFFFSKLSALKIIRLREGEEILVFEAAARAQVFGNPRVCVRENSSSFLLRHLAILPSTHGFEFEF